MRVFTSADEVIAAKGETLGTTDWLTIDQARIDAFADATDDHQWIHVDPERAATGPFGSTIAHGFLTLSLATRFGWELYSIENTSMSINYGLNKVRFVYPVRVDSRIRCTAVLSDVTAVQDGVQVVITKTIEIDVDGTPRPACVAETVGRYYFQA